MPVARNDNEILGDGLRDEQPIERIAVMEGEVGDAENVPAADRQLFRRQIRQGFGDDGVSHRKLARAAFDGDFP